MREITFTLESISTLTKKEFLMRKEKVNIPLPNVKLPKDGSSLDISNLYSPASGHSSPLVPSNSKSEQTSILSVRDVQSQVFPYKHALDFKHIVLLGKTSASSKVPYADTLSPKVQYDAPIQPALSTLKVTGSLHTKSSWYMKFVASVFDALRHTSVTKVVNENFMI
jgi:hypothetical protein